MGKNGNTSPGIGPGKDGSCGTVTIGGVEVGLVGKSPYTYNPNDPDGPDIPDITEIPDIPIHYNIVNIDDSSTAVMLHDKDILIGEGDAYVVIPDGATVMLGGVDLTSTNGPCIICEGDATITLVGDNAVRAGRAACPGILIFDGKTLTIQGDGSLSATGGDFGAGIGGGSFLSCGNIVIEGGNITATGGSSAAGIGSGNLASCGNITIGAGIRSLVASGMPSIGGCNNPTITIASGLVMEGSLGGGTVMLRPPPTDYELWAVASGISGAWDATDALGIHNVFRYAFDKPTGAFEDPPLISISFENGQPVVHTPPLVNTEGYTFSILATDTLDGTGASATYTLNPSGRTPIPASDNPARFFRLRAVEQ